jgi:hypothetical protein
MSHKGTIELKRMSNPVLFVRALFRWLVEGHGLLRRRPALTALYHAERCKHTLKKKGIPFTEAMQQSGEIKINFTVTGNSMPELCRPPRFDNALKKEPERSLDEAARDLDFETGGRCGQLRIE